MEPQTAANRAPSSPTTRPAPAPATISDDVMLSLWTRDLAREHGYEPLDIEGELPAALRGTLYRNGPGQYGQFGRRYTHPFEADGAITGIRIADQRAYGASRLHQTAGLAEERAAGKQLYGLATSWPRRFVNNVRGRFKNTANTSVMAWQGRVFGLMEAARPLEVNPSDLSTIGDTDLGCIGPMFSAHPHRVASRKAIYNFGLEYGRVTRLHCYELPDVGAARRLATVELAGPPMLHDFIATPHHLIFFISPVRVVVPRMLLGIGNFDQLFRYRPELGTEVICVPIDRPGEVIRFSTDAFYQWHFSNAFERDDGAIVVDYVRYANFDSFSDIGSAGRGRIPNISSGYFHRAVLDVRARTFRTEQRNDRACEFPTVEPGREGQSTDIAFAVFDELRAIGSIDVSTGRVSSHSVPTGHVVTEPLYANGHLLALCHAPERAYVAVYRADRIPDGPVAKLWFDHHIPITFHGTYVADQA